MLTTTLNRIRACSPCASGWTRLLAGLGKTQADDEPLPYADILRINGLDDALWACRAEPKYARQWRMLAVKLARAVERLLTDERSRAALDVAERHARGEATDAELARAGSEAWSVVAYAHAHAADDADADADAAYAAAYAAAAAVAADAAAYAASYAASYSYAAAAYAAAYASSYAPAQAAQAAARADQERFFLEIVS